MNKERYKAIYERLNTKNINYFHKKFRLSRELLRVILTQKIIRQTKSRYPHIKKQAPALLADWSTGTSFIELADRLSFSPVMVASIILQEKKVTRKQFRGYLRNIDGVEDRRLRRELREAIRDDIVYSPKGAVIQRERGKMVEKKVEDWLTKKRVKFLTEKESKELKHEKTPDFLLEKPLRIFKKKIKWIECKASFGDDKEIQRDYKKQLSHYVRIFGPGAVVYWYGFLKTGIDKNVIPVSRKLFKH